MPVYAQILLRRFFAILSLGKVLLQIPVFSFNPVNPVIPVKGFRLCWTFRSREAGDALGPNPHRTEATGIYLICLTLPVFSVTVLTEGCQKDTPVTSPATNAAGSARLRAEERHV